MKCTCPRGQDVCHHIAALCLHAHHNVSITDKACVWSAKTTLEKESVQTIKDLYPSKHSDYVAIQNTVSEADVDSFRSKLGSGNVVGFSWLLQQNCEEDVEAFLPSIENIIFSTEYLETPNKKEYIIDKCRITESQVQLVIENTLGQAKNENWLIARKNRITASNFGSILAAVERNRFPPSLYKRLTDGYDLSSVLAVQWGKEHEKVAVETFISNIEGAEVIPTGLWLDTCGFLGASPDGLCGDSCIVEVKCPYKFRNSSLSEALKNDKTYVIYKKENETLINFDHDYYHQIQGQLHITNREMCYLVIWTPNECEVACILKNEDWFTNLDILKNFYLNKFVPYISGMNS